MVEDEDTLAQVVEHQRRQCHADRPQPDRPGAEVTPIGVQRLCARDRQHHAAKHKVAGGAVIDEEPDGPGRDSAGNTAGSLTT